MGVHLYLFLAFRAHIAADFIKVFTIIDEGIDKLFIFFFSPLLNVAFEDSQQIVIFLLWIFLEFRNKVVRVAFDLCGIPRTQKLRYLVEISSVQLDSFFKCFLLLCVPGGPRPRELDRGSLEDAN